MCRQEGESADSFIISLNHLVEHCNYCDLSLSEGLQTDSELILEKAITMTEQMEAVREQQPKVRDKIAIHTRIEATEYSYSNKTLLETT